MKALSCCCRTHPLGTMNFCWLTDWPTNRHCYSYNLDTSMARIIPQATDNTLALPKQLYHPCFTSENESRRVKKFDTQPLSLFFHTCDHPIFHLCLPWVNPWGGQDTQSNTSSFINGTPTVPEPLSTLWLIVHHQSSTARLNWTGWTNQEEKEF